MANQQRKQTTLVLTFQVLRFVHQLRQRVKPRVFDGSINSVMLGAPHRVCDSKNGPSRISARRAKRMRQLNRVRRSIQRNPALSRLSLGVQRPRAGASATPSVCSDSSNDDLRYMLNFVDGQHSFSEGSFSTVASNNQLFLRHNNAPIIEAYSLNKVVALLVTTQNALDTFSDCRGLYGDELLAAQALDLGIAVDELFLANYEHMLLRLRAELLEAVKRKVLEELLHGGHDKRQRMLLSWFSEFAEKPQPLSSSFPWTIKPSLAVLWGVCWMFYDNADYALAEKAAIRPDRVLHNIQWDAPASSDYIELGRALIGAAPPHSQQQPLPPSTIVESENDLSFQAPKARNTATWQPDLTFQHSRPPSLTVGQAGASGPPNARALLPSRDTYYCPILRQYQQDQQDQLSPFVPNNLYLPHNQGSAVAAQPLTAFSLLGTDYSPNSWHPASSLPQSSPRHLNTSPLPPSIPGIRVTGSPGNDIFGAQPHPHFASSAVDIYQLGRQPEALPLHDTSYNPFYPTDSQFFANMSTEQSSNSINMQISTIAPMSPKHERKSSVASNSHSMPTPISLAGTRSPLLSPTSGERSHMSTSTSPQIMDRRLSEDRSSMSGEDDGNMMRKISYKRAEDPPRNSDGKFYCKYQECKGQYFERKCEWSKHMDKHDRPYKCNVKGCEKLQGFTYSGGLLRHEREVHKMHGGTKKSLFCPFNDCKRSSGAGFTRKENLAEHIRRVHRRTSMSADMHGLVLRRDTLEASPIAESRVASESPYSRAMEYRDDEDAGLKRKRGSDSGLSDRDNDEMRAEIKRLRQENEEKDSRLRQLEQAVMALQQNSRR